MTSLRERLERKTRKRAVIRVQVDDTTEAEEALRVHQGALDLRVQMRPHLEQQDGFDVARFDADIVRLRANVTEAKEAHEACFSDVEVQALAPEVFDQVLATAGQDPDGEIDLDDVRAALLAASCVDPELQDTAWWEAQLANPVWTKGERLAMNTTLLRLNLNTPSGRQGNG